MGTLWLPTGRVTEVTSSAGRCAQPLGGGFPLRRQRGAFLTPFAPEATAPPASQMQPTPPHPHPQPSLGFPVAV